MELRRWQTIRTVVAEALELPTHERERFAAERCAGDVELEAEVRAFLAAETDGIAPWFRVGDLPTLVPGDFVSRYEILGEAGVGGMGVVYRARAEHRDVAIKILGSHPGVQAVQELRASARLQHPNIARLYDNGTTRDGYTFLVLEYIDGVPLDEYVKRHCPTLDERLGIFSAICDAVRYAHREMIVHRDLKPQNILVEADGAPKIIDFGISQELPRDPDSDGEKQVGNRALTPTYASPEQASGKATNRLTDVYSLGVILCELLSGKLPYPFSGREELLAAIEREGPTLPSSLVDSKREMKRLQGDLDAIVARALAKTPKDRYQSVEALQEDLERYRTWEPVDARDGGSGYVVFRFVRRNRWWVTVAAVFVVVVMAFVGALLVKTAEATYQRGQAEETARHERAVSDFLVDVFTTHDETLWDTHGTTATARELLDRASSTLEARLRGDQELRAELLQTIGTAYGNLGAHRRAEELLRESLSLRTQLYGGEGEEVAESMSSLGGVSTHLGNLDEAETLLRGALKLRRSDPNTPADSLASVLNNLAVVLSTQGRPDEAEPFAREALELRTSSDAASPNARAQSLTHLGNILLHQDRFAEAEQAHRDALRLKQDVLGDSHPWTGTSHINLGNTLASTSRYPEAEEHYSAALLIFRHSFVEGHPDIITAMDGLASALVGQKKYRQAEALRRESLALGRKYLEPTHPDLATSINNLAFTIYQSDPNRTAEAIPLFEEAIELLKVSTGPRSRKVTIATGNLAAMLYRMGDLEEAESRSAEAVACARDAFGEDHSEAAHQLRNRGRFLIALGRYQEAEEALRRATRIFEQKLPENDALIPRTRCVLAESIFRQGRFDEAEDLLSAGYLRLQALEREGVAVPWTVIEEILATYEDVAGIERAARLRERLTEQSGAP